jgi:hypothetical protein
MPSLHLELRGRLMRAQSSVRQLTCQAEGPDGSTVGSAAACEPVVCSSSSEALAVNQHRRPRACTISHSFDEAWPMQRPILWDPCGGDARTALVTRTRRVEGIPRHAVKLYERNIEVLTRLVYMDRSFLHLPIPPAKVTCLGLSVGAALRSSSRFERRPPAEQTSDSTKERRTARRRARRPSSKDPGCHDTRAARLGATQAQPRACGTRWRRRTRVSDTGRSRIG